MMRGPHRQIVLKLQIDSFYKDEPSLTFDNGKRLHREFHKSRSNARAADAHAHGV